MPLCNRKGSLLNLIIKDLEKEDPGSSGSGSASSLPPGSPLLGRSRSLLPASPLVRRKGNSLPATASPLLHRKFPSLTVGSSGSPSLKRRSLDGKDLDPLHFNRERKTSPVKIRYRRSSKPELYKSKFSFENKDIVETLKVKFEIGGESSEDERTDTGEETDDTYIEGSGDVDEGKVGIAERSRCGEHHHPSPSHMCFS